jgi:type I restriction enzyme S subunit
MELKPGYKRTEVGVIPEEWDVQRLAECGEVVMGQSPPGESYNRSGKGSPLINGPTEFTERVPVRIQWTTAPARFCKAGDLLICVRGSSTGRVNYADDVYSIGRGVAAIRARHPNSTEYVSRRVVAGVSTILAAATGSTFPSVDGASFRNLLIAIPKPEEQEAIAGALSDVDSLLDGLDRLIAKKCDLKQAVMQQLLTGRTRLPGFKENWKHIRLGDHVTYLSHATHARAVLMTEGNVRYLHYGDVHAASSIWLDPQATPMPFVPERLAARFDRLETGDLVFVDASEDLTGIGKSVELRNAECIEIIAGLHTITARFDKSVLADGFKGYLQFMPPFKAQLQRLAAGTKVYASNKSHVSSVEIELPDVKEQILIAEALNDMAAEIAALERRRTKAQLLKQAMMQELLTGRTRLVETQGAIA